MADVVVVEPKKRPRYACGVCGFGVLVLADAGNTSIVKACLCNGAIVANAEAVVVGHGGVKG